MKYILFALMLTACSGRHPQEKKPDPIKDSLDLLYEESRQKYFDYVDCYECAVHNNNKKEADRLSDSSRLYRNKIYYYYNLMYPPKPEPIKIYKCICK